MEKKVTAEDISRVAAELGEAMRNLKSSPLPGKVETTKSDYERGVVKPEVFRPRSIVH